MDIEKKLVEYICHAVFEDLPQESINVAKYMILAIVGTTIAGAGQQGCDALTEFYRGLGGKEESTVFIKGGKLPTQDAAFINSYTARAVDYCDAMAPGMHIGASAVPTALAIGELSGHCSGKELITAIVMGAEIATRLNLSESAYNGFSPTGVCAIFSSTAVASKLLHLNEDETLNALALAFNRSGGSFQSNIDAALAVRCVQGWVAQNGIICSRLAKLGITGPRNFLEGVYGYFHLYGKDMVSPESILEELGERYGLHQLVFKKYPSCGLTQGCTDAILNLAEQHELTPENVDRIEVRVPPYTYKLVGQPFQVGDNPRVNAQFSIQYCTANALLRNGSKLHHFDESCVSDPKIGELIGKISVVIDSALEKRGHTALDMLVFTSEGDRHVEKVDIAPGFPGNPLSEKDHENHFWNCVEYASGTFSKEKAREILELVHGLESLRDVRILISLLSNSRP
jgi:2-methylcitrate dehydratase PrpD